MPADSNWDSGPVALSGARAGGLLGGATGAGFGALTGALKGKPLVGALKGLLGGAAVGTGGGYLAGAYRPFSNMLWAGEPLDKWYPGRHLGGKSFNGAISGGVGGGLGGLLAGALRGRSLPAAAIGGLLGGAGGAAAGTGFGRIMGDFKDQVLGRRLADRNAVAQSPQINVLERIRSLLERQTSGHSKKSGHAGDGRPITRREARRLAVEMSWRLL